MARIANAKVTPQGVVTYNKGVVVQDTASQFQAKKTILKTYQILWYLLGALEILLAFRVILRMLGANPASGFAQLIYNLSEPFVMPFWGIFGVSRPVGGSAIEWSTIFAMVVYFILTWGIINLLQIIKPVTPEEVERKVDSV